MSTDTGIVVAGHICLDIIPALDAESCRAREMIVPGRLVKVGPATIATGGVVANTGLALHRLGVPVRLMGKLGDDLLGRAVLGILADHSPALAEDMIVAPAGGSSYTIVISPPGTDRTFLHHPGVNDTYAAADVPFDRLGGSGIFHFGYPPLMRRMYADGGGELARVLRGARDRGMAVSLDMSMPDLNGEAGRADWPGILARALPHVDVFAPSFDEILLMLDRGRFDRLAAGAGGNLAAGAEPSLLRRLAEALVAMGAAIVALKLGDRGLYLRTTDDAGRLERIGGRLACDWGPWRGRELLVPCFAVDVAGTTGSGDATVAGLLAGLIGGQPPPAALRSAVGVGAASVERADATSGVPAWDVVQRRIAAGWPRRAGATPVDWRWDESEGLWAGPGDR